MLIELLVLFTNPQLHWPQQVPQHEPCKIFSFYSFKSQTNQLVRLCIKTNHKLYSPIIIIFPFHLYQKINNKIRQMEYHFFERTICNYLPLTVRHEYSLKTRFYAIFIVFYATVSNKKHYIEWSCLNLLSRWRLFQSQQQILQSLECVYFQNYAHYSSALIYCDCQQPPFCNTKSYKTKTLIDKNHDYSK